MIQLGDMAVLLAPPPAMLAKALAVIADTLHPAFAREKRFRPGASFESCVLCSLTVRDFLRRIGFRDAAVRPVGVIMLATEGGRLVHSLGIGMPPEAGGDDRQEAGHWNGHLVATAQGWLIDTTLYPAIRPAWADAAPMMAAPMEGGPGLRKRLYDLPCLVGAAFNEDDREFCIAWLDNPDNRRWQQGPDGRDRQRRLPVVRALIERFGVWEKAA
jgi:hypothetical protein